MIYTLIIIRDALIGLIVAFLVIYLIIGFAEWDLFFLKGLKIDKEDRGPIRLLALLLIMFALAASWDYHKDIIC
jgi:hypothetical protein